MMDKHITHPNESRDLNSGQDATAKLSQVHLAENTGVICPFRDGVGGLKELNKQLSQACSEDIWIMVHNIKYLK